VGRLAALALFVLAQACCAQAPAAPPILLFGEVHDNAAGHALRLNALEALLRTGARPAMLMEQFDRERQTAIDRVLAGSAAPEVDQIILAGSGAPASENRSWNWLFYRPLIALALQHGLPLIAANVSRDDARRVISDGLGATGFDAAVAPDIERAQAEAIEASHCGMLDAPQARRMASAQVARDQFMARQVEAHAQRGVVLFAGNGHVRKDIGVPRWLSPATRARTESIGVLEADAGEPTDDAAAFDRVLVAPRPGVARPSLRAFSRSAVFASASARSLYGSPLWPRTQRVVTLRASATA
jgi:uncharacterized iron-regulated protein